MSMEWKSGRLMTDDEIEQYYQFCERAERRKLTRYDATMGVLLCGLIFGSVVALVFTTAPNVWQFFDSFVR